MPAPLQFSISHLDPTSRARKGVVTTPHGSFDTPAFMPVGTRASVKGLLPQHVKETGAQIILNNTYHLLLRPGPELVQRMGGVHKFMNWPGPILTDSGGYQAYSLSAMNTVDDDGVTFKSTIDGSMVRMSPEIATRVQNQLGPDIMMAFDDCPPSVAATSEDHDASQTHRLASASRGLDAHTRLRIANERTVRWLERCKAAHARPDDQALFGIVQGGADLEQRSWSAERICNIELPGYAIGGVAVGESFTDISRVVNHTAPLLPTSKPRYLMGVGYERDILAAVRAGVDMFDCVLPTRNGRNANAFTPKGQIRLRNAKHSEDQGPIEAGCDCIACNPTLHNMQTPDGLPFSRGYLRHLFMVSEMLGPILVSLHNLRYFQRFMQEVRQAIVLGNWSGLLLRYPIAADGFMELSATPAPKDSTRS